MTATLLETHSVAKPWGRHQLWPGFENPQPNDDPIGEVWFNEPGNSTPDLLIKYLFTAEKLSVQVHPNDAQAHAAGLPRGKDECWTILDAEPGATIALGTKEPTDSQTLHAAALDGSIEDLLEWVSVKAGDFFYVPSGTIHAIGAGITLVEVQQNSETTYRIFDYGRPRELHLAEGLEVAIPRPYVAQPRPEARSNDRLLLVDGPKFVLELLSDGDHSLETPDGQPAWILAIHGSGTIDDQPFQAGQCFTLSATSTLHADAGSDILYAYPVDTGA